LRILEPVDRAHVRVVERREQPRLALETREPVGVAREGRRQHLERHRALELRVLREIDLAHAALAELALDAIVEERGGGPPGRLRGGRPRAQEADSASDPGWRLPPRAR